jgi:hypothetical protein
MSTLKRQNAYRLLPNSNMNIKMKADKKARNEAQAARNEENERIFLNALNEHHINTRHLTTENPFGKGGYRQSRKRRKRRRKTNKNFKR